jgi:sterol desaturase/sphingolipid hydroxylase (fatty acid hydroxylase superfamily)
LEPVVVKPLTLVSPLFFNVSERILSLYFLLGTVSDLLAHSQLRWGYGWIGRWLVQSPYVHQVHHSKEEEHPDLHFSICPLWDHLVGTWYKGTKLPTQFGIPDPAHEVRPLTQFVLDAGIFYANLARWLSAPLQRQRISGTESPSAR